MNHTGISAQLKRMRLARGLTLKALARRAGTSIPTVCRYENGWNRFELYTLSKLATALGCRLRVELESMEPHPGRHESRSSIRQFQRLFWDRTLRASDLTEYPGWVIKRVLEYGALEDIHALSSRLGREELLRCISEIRFDSIRTGNLWRQILEQEGIPCTRKFSRNEALSCWQS